MILSITRIELNSYSKMVAFFRFNASIMNELKRSECKKVKISTNWNLKKWYTMTLWENERDIDAFYRNGTHLEAMKQSRKFSSKIQSRRLNGISYISWKEAKKMLNHK